jgi:predicted RNA methylase
VNACDILEETARAARNLVWSLGLEEVILVRHGDVRQISLPEPVDVCVSEIVEAIGGAEGAAVLLNDARRFLKPAGTMVPVRSTTAARYVRKIFDEIGREAGSASGTSRRNLRSGPAVFEDLDFLEVVSPEFQHSFRMEIASDGRLDSLFGHYMVPFSRSVSDSVAGLGST